MLHLLYIEWLKLKNYRTFWILAALYLISISGINYITLEFIQKAYENPAAKLIAGVHPFSFPDVWQTVTYMSSFTLFLPGLLIIINYTNEFNYKTHRQNIIDGYSRQAFITVKIVLVLLLAIISTLVVSINAAAFGITHNETPFSFEKAHYIGLFFVQCLNYFGLALLLSVLFKRAALAVGVYFIYITILENMIAGIINRYKAPAGNFFPIDSADSLITFPMFKEAQKTLPIIRPELWQVAIACGIYIIIYYAISYWRFSKQDL